MESEHQHQNISVTIERGEVFFFFFYLCVICDVESYVLTVTDVAVFDGWTRSLATHTHS